MRPLEGQKIVQNGSQTKKIAKTFLGKSSCYKISLFNDKFLFVFELFKFNDFLALLVYEATGINPCLVRERDDLSECESRCIWPEASGITNCCKKKLILNIQTGKDNVLLVCFSLLIVILICTFILHKY